MKASEASDIVNLYLLNFSEEGNHNGIIDDIDNLSHPKEVIVLAYKVYLACVGIYRFETKEHVDLILNYLNKLK